VAEIDASGGRYDALTAAQRRLVDDWVTRVEAATGRTVAAAGAYDALSLSTRTTFNAVTHALAQTALTGQAGESMNLTALDLVAHVDAVAGRVADAGGDKQFRMYVQLVPDAQARLAQSREFARQVDNTVYHRGYPICFRGAGGTPSIQFSLSQDGTRGDIDVDYRSSAFPIMLINGHLTASNSDVRAGNNDERHSGRWTGLLNWWRTFMGLPLAETEGGSGAGKAVATEPRRGQGTAPEEAIADFLTAWLVEQNPGVAAGYVATRALACVAVERGTPVDMGVARFQLVAAMEAVNRRLGRVARLSDAIRGVSLTGPRGKAIPQTYGESFVMYDVREDLAESVDCENRLHPERADPQKAQSTRFGAYIGAVFQVRTAAVTGDAVATLWAQENGVWKLVAYDVEPEFRPGPLPAAPPGAPADVPLRVVDGNPDMLRAAADFFDAWLVRKDVPAAFRALAPSSYSCYNVYRSDDAAPAASRVAAGPLILERMRQLAEWVGPASRVDDVLVAADVHHPDLLLVKHAAAGAFTVVAVPDLMADAVSCLRLKPGEAPELGRTGPPAYGTYYAASLRLKRAGPDGATLWTLWEQQGAAWKVIAYLVITP
jgi:hypothetical protein